MHLRRFLKTVALDLGDRLMASSPEPVQPFNVGSSTAPLAAADWGALRQLFSLRQDQIQLASYILSSHPVPVREAIEHYRQRLDYDPVATVHEAFYRAEPAIRAAAARYLGGHPDQIALTDSTTMGLAMVFSGLTLQPGDEVLHTSHDHYAMMTAIEHRAARTGAQVRQVSLYDMPTTVSVGECVARLKAAVTAATRVVAVTWVHSSTGVKLPIRALADLIDEINRRRSSEEHILLCVDGVHGLGVEDFDVTELGCDFFIAGTHKWLFGPRGTGLIWGSTRGWERCKPVIPSFSRSGDVWRGSRTLIEVPVGEHMTPGGFHSFEHRWALPQAFTLHLQLGKTNVQNRIHKLNTLAKEGLADMHNVNLHTPMSPELSSGLVCFEVRGLKAHRVVKRMHREGVVIDQTPYRQSYARLGPSLLNNEKEIVTALEAISRLAGS
ncbi:MAG: selenocysteine lyase/cysteine desulfurase [Halieaceae bacterium]|jgi:selenocysteine lyase/cysteine desulfurase